MGHQDAGGRVTTERKERAEAARLGDMEGLGQSSVRREVGGDSMSRGLGARGWQLQGFPFLTPRCPARSQWERWVWHWVQNTYGMKATGSGPSGQEQHPLCSPAGPAGAGGPPFPVLSRGSFCHPHVPVGVFQGCPPRHRRQSFTRQLRLLSQLWMQEPGLGHWGSLGTAGGGSGRPRLVDTAPSSHNLLSFFSASSKDPCHGIWGPPCNPG